MSEIKGAVPTPINPLRISTTGDVGHIVRAQRKQQAMRIDDAAALTGVSVDLFSRLENGKGGVRLDKLLSVLDAMGLCMVVTPKTHHIANLAPHGAPTAGLGDGP